MSSVGSARSLLPVICPAPQDAALAVVRMVLRRASPSTSCGNHQRPPGDHFAKSTVYTFQRVGSP